MTCEELEELLHPYLDGELTPAQRTDVEQHLAGCADCRAQLKDFQSLHSALQAPELRLKASDTLKQRLAKGLAEEDSRKPRPRWYPWAAAAAVAVLAVALGWGFLFHGGSGSEDDAMVDATVDQQEHAVAAKHMVDLAATSTGSVQTWLMHQLPFVPPVPDMKPQGYFLQGVRVATVKGIQAAALTYRHGDHLITVFICPAGKGGDKDLDTDTDDDYHVAYWTKGRFSFWVVSQASLDDVKQFGTLLRAAG